MPYLGVFLDSRGFSSADIGQLTAVITLSRIVGPYMWALLADKSGKNLRTLQLGCLLSLATLSLVLVVDSFWGLTLVIGLMMMFSTAILPQIEVLTMSCIQGNSTRYGRIRLWGSIGYILLTIFTGMMIDAYSAEAPVIITLAVLFLLFVGSIFLLEPERLIASQQAQASIWHKILTPVFLCFLLSALLLQVSFGPYYGFFALYARDLGYSGQATGWLIAVGVIVEVGIFVIAGGVIKRCGVKWILVLSIGLTSFRWALLAAFPDNIYLLIISQMLHAFSFGMTHAASIHFIHQYFGKIFQSRGQAIYISVAFGIGGALGNFGAGSLWSQGEGAELTFWLASIAAFCAAICLLPISSKHMSTAP
ncbi:MFS transporter [Paraglaciecola hydrolytica]|uniref:MFS transporter n=1 Tax=Paraglaciecola hydrolytica TaxID=1799789 RepID=A0A148KNX8_9ALTE|nr:MFS transporter [Paraglaciecola hydrolytica]